MVFVPWNTPITDGPLLDSFATMLVNELPEGSVKVVSIDTGSQFARDVVVITIEVPNEVVEDYHVQ